MHVKNKHTYQTIKSKTQQLDKKTKLSHERSIVESLFCRTRAASWQSSSQIRVIRLDVGGKDKKFLSFIQTKEEKTESSLSIKVTKKPNGLRDSG